MVGQADPAIGPAPALVEGTRQSGLPRSFNLTMMRLIAALSAALVLLPAPSAAQLTLTGNTSAPVVAHTGSTAISATFNGAPGAAMVGPFSMTFGGIFAAAIQPVVSVDLNNSFADGQAFAANVTLLSSTDFDLTTRTRQGMWYGNGYSSRQSYLAMAWLANLLDSQPTTDWAGIQGAIWNVGTAWNPLGGTTNPGVQFWLDQLAAADLSTVDANAWAIVTDVNATGKIGGAQEFIVRANVVPEPSTYALMLTGFAGLVVVARRRRMV